MKKQLAVVMAAATAVTTVAPAIVSADVIQANDTEAVKTLKNTVKENMRLKYVDDANQLVDQTDSAKKIADTSVFKVVMTVDGSDKNYTTYSAFEKAFDDAYTDLDQGESIQVNLVSNYGYRKLADGTITNADEANTYEKNSDGKLTDDGVEVVAVEDATEVGEVEFEQEDDGNYTYKIKLSDYDGDTDRYLAIAEDDDVLDTTKPTLKVENGFYVNEDGDPIVEQKDKDVATLTGGVITIVRDDATDPAVSNDDAAKCVVDGYQVKLADVADTKTIRNAVQKDVETFEVKAQDFYDVDNGRLTTEANNLLAKLERQHDFDSMDGTNTVVYKDGNGNKVAKVKVVKDSGDKDGKAYKAVNVDGVLENMAKLVSEDVVGKNYIVQAAGEDRYASAVQVARAMNGEKDVDTVVLVSGDSKAMVDGLTAAPYAHSLGKNVPVLLTQKDALPESVVDFLKDKNVKTVKIIGGENSVSQKVIDQLENDLVITDTDRFSGTDRFSTAMEVADEINDDKDVATGEAYLVSGYATPDSLSIAGYAASKNAPILLTKKDSIPSDVKSFIEDESRDSDKKVRVNIIGGLNSVSNDVVRTILSDVDGASIRRVSGDDRQATNAEVIDTFTQHATDFVIARGDGHAIIDALAAGAYAGQDEHRALVLTGSNGMSRDQKDNLADQFVNVLQVGYSVNATDADYIFDNMFHQADGE